MTFVDLTDEERLEWLAHPSTQAFFASLKEQEDDAFKESANALNDDKDPYCLYGRRMAGRLDGFAAVRNLAAYVEPTKKETKK